MKFGFNRAQAARAERLLNILDIVTTKDRAERHRRIQELGVVVTETPANDGRRGIVKTFFVGHTARARILEPAKPLLARAESAATVRQSSAGVGGPSDSAGQLGRWKFDGNGGCYWDPNDDGYDQCEPPTGRWKSGATCYWDPSDSGPDQCAPVYEGEPGAPGCSYQGVPDACASVQDGEDLMALAVSMEPALDDAEVAYDSANDYCNQFGCDDDPAESRPSGPSADVVFNCVEEGVGAAADLGAALWARVELYSLGSSIAVDAAAVAVGEVAATVAVSTVTIIGGIVAVHSFIHCIRAKEPVPVPATFEPTRFW
jgi:hypothetical protein